MSLRADALTAALVLRRPEASRNRNFALHATHDGAEARKRASRLLGLVRQITGAFGPVREVVTTATAGDAAGDAAGNAAGDEVRLRYVLARVSLVRETRLSAADLSVLRLALARAGARVLPAPLAVHAEDRVRVDALLAEFDAHAREPAHS